MLKTATNPLYDHLLEIFIKCAKVLAILFPLFGILNAVTYYQYFEINIIEYLSFGEVITLFLNDIIALCLILSFLLAFEWGFCVLLVKYHAENKTKVSPWMINLLTTLVLIAWSVSLGIKVYYQYVLDIPYQVFRDKTAYFSYVTFFSFYILIHLISLHIEEKRLVFDKYVENIIIFFLFFFVMFIWCRALSKAVLLWEFPEKQTKMTVEANDGSGFSTGKDTIYIGRTNSFLFFYIKKQETSMILPSADVKKIFIKKDIVLDSTRKYPGTSNIIP